MTALLTKAQAIQDRVHMARAIQLAKKGQFTVSGNPLVGCVIVKDSKVLAEGWHKQAGHAHAEVDAVQKLSNANDAKGATAYVSLEPCCHQGKTGPCAQVLIEAGISRVVCASRDPAPHVSGGGIQALLDAGVEVLTGLLEEEAKAINQGFFKRMERGLPFVRLKVAMSIDGKTALKNGQSQWITGAEARADVHRWRAKSHAIVTGADTVLVDDPLMNARYESLEEGAAIDQPLRVVVDSKNRVSREAKIFSDDGKCKIVGVTDQSDWNLKSSNTLEKKASENLLGKVDLFALLEKLAAEQVNEVWVEAGASLAGAFIEQSLVDEVVLYVAPILLGDKARSLFNFAEITSMNDKKPLALLSTRQIGDDTRMIFSCES